MCPELSTRSALLQGEQVHIWLLRRTGGLIKGELVRRASAFGREIKEAGAVLPADFDVATESHLGDQYVVGTFAAYLLMGQPSELEASVVASVDRWPSDLTP